MISRAGDGSPRLQVLHHDLSGGIGVKHAIAGANGRAAAVCDLEGHASQRFVGGPLNVFADREVHSGVIFESQVVAIAGMGATASISSRGSAAVHGIGAILHNDGFGHTVQHIAIRHLGFGHHHSAAGNKARHNDSPILAGGVAAQHSAVAVLYSELGAGNRFAGDGGLSRGNLAMLYCAKSYCYQYGLTGG